MIAFGDRRYRVRGLPKNLTFETLKVNVLVTLRSTLPAKRFHVDTLDLYSGANARRFVSPSGDGAALHEESVIKHDLGRLLLKLEALQERAIEQALKLEAGGARR